MQENEHKKEQSSRKQNNLQHKKSFVTRYTRGEILQKVAKKRTRRSVWKFRKVRENANKKRSFFTRYAQERKALIFRAELN